MPNQMASQSSNRRKNKHKQQPSNTSGLIAIKTGDNHVVYVEEEVARMFDFIDNTLYQKEEYGDTKVVKSKFDDEITLPPTVTKSVFDVSLQLN